MLMLLTTNIRLASIVADIHWQNAGLERYRILWAILWGKGQKLRDQIIEKRKFHAPSFNGTPTEESHHTHLNLRCAIAEYLATTADAPAYDLDSLLPCLTNNMLVTEAYAEAFAYLSQRDAERERESMPVAKRQQGGGVSIEFKKTQIPGRMLTDPLLRQANQASGKPGSCHTSLSNGSCEPRQRLYK